MTLIVVLMYLSVKNDIQKKKKKKSSDCFLLNMFIHA